MTKPALSRRLQRRDGFSDDVRMNVWSLTWDTLLFAVGGGRLQLWAGLQLRPLAGWTSGRSAVTVRRGGGAVAVRVERVAKASDGQTTLTRKANRLPDNKQPIKQ